jgi:bifunctional non-homologous end joining protein LigD
MVKWSPSTKTKSPAFRNNRQHRSLYYVFDVLWHDGDDLTGKLIMERRQILERIIKPTGGIQIGTYIEGEGMALFDLTKQKGMEGIIAKPKESIYRPGMRSSDWLKIKARLQQEFVVGGFTEGKGSRQRLGALLLGAFRNGKLRCFGHSGSGLSEKGIDEALHRMEPLSTDKSPFDYPPKVKEKIQWIEPKSVHWISNISRAV